MFLLIFVLVRIFLDMCGYLIEEKNGYIGCWKLLSMSGINKIYVAKVWNYVLMLYN